jgi:hypothetical protein
VEAFRDEVALLLNRVLDAERSVCRSRFLKPVLRALASDLGGLLAMSLRPLESAPRAELPIGDS